MARFAGFVALAVGGLGVALAQSSPAQSVPNAQPVAFVATAAASGMRVTYTIPQYLAVEQIIDSGAPVVQTTLESNGRAAGFASTPYPGELAVTLGGTVAGFTGAPTGDLHYPLIASADHPTRPSGHVADPTGQYLLGAEAGEGLATATAMLRLGGDAARVAGATADARTVTEPDGTVLATATTETDGIALGEGVVRIGSVRSTSTTRLGEDGSPQPASSLVLSGVTIAGQDVGLGPGGVTVAGQPVGVPIDDVLAAANAALEGVGISMRVVDGLDVKGGAMADVLEITIRHRAPAPGPPEGVLVLHLGGATTSLLTGAPFAGAVEPLVPLASPATPGTPSAPSGPAAVAPVAAPSLTPGGGAVEGVAALPARRTRDLLDLRDHTRAFYLVLAAGGAALVAVSSIWRKTRGEQGSWTQY